MTASGEFVLVPRQPTEAMIENAVKGSRADVSYFDAEEAYKAMIAVAPATSAPADDGEAEKLTRLLKGRDDFIVSRGLWTEFVETLRAQPPQPTGDVGNALAFAAECIRQQDGGDQTSETGWRSAEHLDAWLVVNSAISRLAAQAQELDDSNRIHREAIDNLIAARLETAEWKQHSKNASEIASSIAEERDVYKARMLAAEAELRGLRNAENV